MIDLLKPRARNLKDFADAFRGYFTDDYQTDPAAIEKFLKDFTVRQLLAELSDRYANDPEFTEASAEKVLRDFAVDPASLGGDRIPIQFTPW